MRTDFEAVALEECYLEGAGSAEVWAARRAWGPPWVPWLDELTPSE